MNLLIKTNENQIKIFIRAEVLFQFQLFVIKITRIRSNLSTFHILRKMRIHQH